LRLELLKLVCLLCVGESGLGKSTLVGGLFLNPDLYKNRQVVSVEGMHCVMAVYCNVLRYDDIESRGCMQTW
jgi:predicted GTPase